VYEYCWPFPQFNEIVKTFPLHPIDEKIYNIAKDFYSNSMEAEEEQLGEFIRDKSRANEELLFISKLVAQAVHVAIGHAAVRR
jgi:hypothetical protein